MRMVGALSSCLLITLALVQLGLFDPLLSPAAGMGIGYLLSPIAFGATSVFAAMLMPQTGNFALRTFTALSILVTATAAALAVGGVLLQVPFNWLQFGDLAGGLAIAAVVMAFAVVWKRPFALVLAAVAAALCAASAAHLVGNYLEWLHHDMSTAVGIGLAGIAIALISLGRRSIDPRT